MMKFKTFAPDIFPNVFRRVRMCYVVRRIRDKKLSYCWETVRRESMPRIAEMDAEITT